MVWLNSRCVLDLPLWDCCFGDFSSRICLMCVGFIDFVSVSDLSFGFWVLKGVCAFLLECCFNVGLLWWFSKIYVRC